MKHYKNLMSALGDAMPVCLAWRLTGTEDNFFNARDLFAFALSDEEEEGSLKEGQFYVVSSEGAIGISSGYEYFVRWLFIPLEGNAYDQEVMRLKQELENDTKPQPVPQSELQPNMQPQGIGQPRGMSQSNMQVQGTGQSNVPPQGMPQYNGQPQAYEQSQGMGQSNVPPRGMPQYNGQPQAYEQSQGMGQSNVPPQGMPQPNVNPQSEEQPRIMPQAGKRQFCIQCGYKLGQNSKFCPGCGAPVNR